MNSTYEVRLILVYTYEYFCNFLFISAKETPLPPPSSTPRTKRHLLCNGGNVFVAKSGIYTHCMRSTLRNPTCTSYLLSFVPGYPSLNDI